MKSIFTRSKQTLFILLWLLSAALYADTLPLELLGDDDNYPACYRGKDGKLAGSDVEIIQEISRRTGIPIHIRLHPWKRVLKMIHSGTVDGGFPLNKTAEREQYSLYTQVPLRKAVHGIFVAPGNPLRYNALEDLYHKRVGIQRGFSISHDFDAAVERGDIKIYEADKVEQLMKMVSSDRLDIMLSKSAHVEKIRQTEKVSLRRIGHIGSDEGTYLVFSKRSPRSDIPQLMLAINHSLQAMAKDGSLNRIVNKHRTMSPLAPPTP